MSKVYYWKTTRNTIRLKRKKRRQHGPIYIKLLKFCKYHPVLIACLAIFLCEGGCYFQRCHGILGFCFNRCFSFCYTFGSCGIVMLSNNSGRHRESYTSTWESPTTATTNWLRLLVTELLRRSKGNAVVSSDHEINLNSGDNIALSRNN